jgi:hypothetical protein
VTPSQKAAATQKRRAAAAKAAQTKKRRAAASKAALTRKRRAAGRKAAVTRARNASAKNPTSVPPEVEKEFVDRLNAEARSWTAAIREYVGGKQKGIA